jgi:hypothetical protein
MPVQLISTQGAPSGATRSAWRAAALAFGLSGLLAGPALADSCKPIPSCRPQFSLDSYDGGVKTPITDCRTNPSSSPCAWADAHVGRENFLACSLEKTGPIALCYYSGVPGPPLLTPGCTFTQDKKAANCDCYQISKGQPRGARYSYILITSILNKRVYEATVARCGKDGRHCLNAANLLAHDKPEAPVCNALRDKRLFRGADLISTFSPILIGSKGITSFACPTDGGTGNLYAGCMTAPCKTTGKTDPSTGLPLVRCTCPTYDGPNQVGNPQIKLGDYSCSPTPNVWSSAYQAPAFGVIPP